MIEYRDKRLAEIIHDKRVDDNDPRYVIINSVAGLIDLMRSLDPMPKTIIEVGSNVGVSTEVFLLFCEKVIAVDPWQDETLYQVFCDRTKGYSNLETVRDESPDAANRFADESVDMVYIDAKHDYASVKTDIFAFAPKVKPGGIIAGHDHFDAGIDGGVTQAVKEVFGEPDWVFPDSSWIVRKR